MDSYTRKDLQAVLDALQLPYALRDMKSILIDLEAITVTRYLSNDRGKLLGQHTIAEHVERIPIVRST